MDYKIVVIGFFLYFLTNAIVAAFFAPFGAMIAGYFGILGAYAAILGSSIISFPILILVFWFASKAGVRGEIPETG